MSDYLDKCSKLYVNAKEPRKRKIGRYNSSEIASIIDYGLTPEEWFNPKKKDLRASNNISWGMNTEDMLTKWLLAGEREFKEQTKDVYKVNEEIEIVAVADYEFENSLLECKCPESIPNDIKPWNKYQLEIQYRVFKKDVYILYLGRLDHKIFKYSPSEARLNKIKVGLIKYHEKIREYGKTN